MKDEPLVFDGAWPDPTEQLVIRALTNAVIPKGDTWHISHADGTEMIISTVDNLPRPPKELIATLVVKTASDLARPPRYLLWNAKHPDLRFGCSDSGTVLIQMIIWYEQDFPTFARSIIAGITSRN